MGEQQRRLLRLNVCLLTAVTVPSTGKAQRALTKDLGPMGACLITNGLIEPKTVLVVELTLPDRDRPITFDAEVIWSKIVKPAEKVYEYPKAQTGIHITRIDPKDQAIMAQYAQLNAATDSS